MLSAPALLPPSVDAGCRHGEPLMAFAFDADIFAILLMAIFFDAITLTLRHITTPPLITAAAADAAMPRHYAPLRQRHAAIAMPCH
jgi:hypothetical protein